MENPIKMDDLGVPLFLETSIYIHQDVPKLSKTHNAIDEVWDLCEAKHEIGRRDTKDSMERIHRNLVDYEKDRLSSLDLQEKRGRKVHVY